MENNYLNKVYDVSTSDSRELYASWATTYDQEVIENGYATPDRVAKALKEYVSDKSTLILDYGCGTGLSGLALQSVGFNNLDGLDVSKEMVRIAEKKSIYKSLKVFDPDTKIPIYSEQYKIITAIGVIELELLRLKFLMIYFLCYRRVGFLLFHSMITRSATQFMKKKSSIM